MCVYTWSAERASSPCSIIPLLDVQDRVSHGTWHSVFFFTLAGQPAIPCLYPPVLGLQKHTSTSNFYVGASDLNLGPHFAKQLLLFTKSFPQTQFNVITRGMFMPLVPIVICYTHMYRYTHTHIKKVFKNIHKLHPDNHLKGFNIEIFNQYRKASDSDVHRNKLNYRLLYSERETWTLGEVRRPVWGTAWGQPWLHIEFNVSLNIWHLVWET